MYNNQLKLSEKATKDLGFSISVSKSLSFDNKNSMTFKIKAQCLGITK